MRHTIRLFKLLLAVFFLPSAVALAFWLGLVPARLLPFAPIDLARTDQWFVDLRLAALKASPQLCRDVLKPPLIIAEPAGDVPFQDGCGSINSVSVHQIAGARLVADKLSCPMAGALTMWLEHVVQPAALDILGARVSSVHHMGTYACRNIMGSKRLSSFRSQHASANAIDVSAFELANGRSVSVLKFWRTPGAESSFLHRIHDGACGYFRVALGPDFNEAHRDHFHLDRGAFKSCK